jgi:hypothetical protein
MSLHTSYSNIHVQLQESCNSTDIIYFESKSVVWGIGQYSHIISGPYHLQFTCKQYNLRKEGRVSEPYEPYAIKLRTAKKPSDGSYGLCANSLFSFGYPEGSHIECVEQFRILHRSNLEPSLNFFAGNFFYP